MFSIRSRITRKNAVLAASMIAPCALFIPSPAHAGYACDMLPAPPIADSPFAVGINAIACGPDANASGDDSVAVGNAGGAAASGAVAIGAGSLAIDTTATIGGPGPQAVPDLNGTATAIGYSAYAFGLNTLAIGDSAAV